MVTYMPKDYKSNEEGAWWTEDISKAYRFNLDEALNAYRSRTNGVAFRTGFDSYNVVLSRDMSSLEETSKESWFDRLPSN